MKNGVPFDVAFSLDEVKRTAFCIIFSEMEGAAFDWNTMRFKEES